MQISKIKASRINNRVNLVFSDNSYLPLFIDDIVSLSLKKGQDLDKETLSLIFEKSINYLSREYALRQIAISPKSQKSLSEKLQKFFIKTSKKYKLPHGFDFQPIKEGIIEEFKSRKFLNQDSFIEYFINKNKYKSVRQITSLLAQQGIRLDPQDVIKRIPNNDLSLIKKYLNKKKVNLEKLADFNYRQKLTAALYRRGFNLGDIKRLIDDYSKLK